jgi:hypothetical protein
MAVRIATVRLVQVLDQDAMKEPEKVNSDTMRYETASDRSNGWMPTPNIVI